MASAVHAHISACVSTAACHCGTSGFSQRAERDKLSCRSERIRPCSCFAKDTVNYGDKTECDGAAERWQGNPSLFWGWARSPRGGWTGAQMRGQERALQTTPCTRTHGCRGDMDGLLITRCKFHIGECCDWTGGRPMSSSSGGHSTSHMKPPHKWLIALNLTLGLLRQRRLTLF